MTDADRHLMTLFAAALDRTSEADRAAYLDAACAGDAALRARVEALLRGHAAAAGFLEPGPADPAATGPLGPAPAAPGAAAGDLVGGRYKLLERAGEGGMGEVWLAEQTEPVRRKVAVKLIKAGMDSEQVVARFEAERQALALMDHPHIAKVLDGGATDRGRPFFVMELVKGVPITRYCDNHRLTPRDRLGLFAAVCSAVQHAHQKGVIHRDLKPSNVLVAPYDGKPVVKVIDFGIAKAAGQPLTERTLFTGLGAVVGTPEYMSPEQAELNNADVDTRSDVYSLGVLLYELLTGTTPLTRQRVREAALLEVLRVVREEDPPKPSTRLSGTAELPAIAAARGLEPARLSRLVRGELDWIVMKALEKDRARRYETATGLAEDVRRYLADEPVVAGPPGAAYRLRKLARRHKPALGAAGVILAALLVAVVGLTASTLRTRRAKADVEAALARERVGAYYQRVALAEREWSANNLARAEELLSQCPEELRGWEWHYLKRLTGAAAQPLRLRNAAVACAFHPDGRRLATADLDGLVHVWAFDTGEELRRFPNGQESNAGRLAFSPDGGRLAATADHGVTEWDADTWEVRRVWRTPSPAVWVQDLAFTPEDRLLVCLSEEVGSGEVHTIVDHRSGEVLFRLDGHRDTVMAIAVSPDGTRLASASHDHTVRVWELPGGRPVFTLSGDGKFWCVRFSPDGTLLAAGGHADASKDVGVFKIWEAATGAERPVPIGHAARSLAFSPDGKRVATAGFDPFIKLWDPATGQEVLSLRGHTDWAMGVAFTPDGHRLVSASWDRTVRVWDGRPERPDEARGGAARTLAGHEDSVNAVAFHPREPRLATAGSDGTVAVWDTRTWDRITAFRTPGIREAKGLAYSPDGKYLLVGGYPARRAVLLDAATGAEVRAMSEHADALYAVAYSPDGKRVASGGLDDHVRVSDAATGRELDRYPAGNWGVLGLAFSPDPSGRYLALAGNDGLVRIRDTTDPASRPRHLDHGRGLFGVAYSPDGTLLASSAERVVRVWDTATAAPVQKVLDTGGIAYGLAFSPDNRFLAWGGSDSTVKVWDRTTDVIYPLRGHTHWVRGVAFSPDGRWVVSASQDKTVRVWRVPK